MDRIEAKIYLTSLGRIRGKALKLADEIEELKAIAESCTVQTNKENVQTSNNGDKLSAIVGEMVDKEKALEQLKTEYACKLNNTRSAMMLINNKRIEDFIKVRYIDEKGLSETATEIGVGWSTIKRVQNKALDEFAKQCSTLYIV